MHAACRTSTCRPGDCAILVQAVMLSFIVASTAATVVPMDGPPLLNSPVFSLATLDNAGQTNMNILTYATPVGIRPHRLWAISLFRETQTHANWLSSGTGVLQQLSSRHAPLMWALGGTSSSEAHADKAAACAALGLPWIEEAEMIGGCERLLPGCELLSADATGRADRRGLARRGNLPPRERAGQRRGPRPSAFDGRAARGWAYQRRGARRRAVLRTR